MRRCVMTVFAAVAMLAGSVPAHAQSAFSDLFVFGDSLVDSGNARAARLVAGGVDPAPSALGYFEGRFSNGFNFADQLSLDLLGTPATAFAFGGTNFSVGGAQAAEVAGDASPSFSEQLALLAASGRTISSTSLVLVTFGGNDVRTQIARAAMTPGYQPTLAPAISALNAGLQSMIDRGARNIVVTGLPDIGQIPIVTQLGSSTLSNLGTTLSFNLNQSFDAAVGSLADRTGYNLQFFDLFGYQADIYADPAAFGLPAALDTRRACLQVAGAAPTCGGFVYFDTIHPTRQLHEAIADGITAQVTAVPEPGNWVLLIVGFGLVGGALRRRDAVRRSVARV